MKGLLRNPAIKILLSVLFICSVLLTALGTAGALAIFSNYNSLFSPAEALKEDLLDMITNNAARSAYYEYSQYAGSADPENINSDLLYRQFAGQFSADNSNLILKFTDSEGNILFENTQTDNVLNTFETSFREEVEYTSVAFSLSFPDWQSYYEYFGNNYQSYYNVVTYADANGVHADVTKYDVMTVTTNVTCSIRADLKPVDELYYEVLLVEYAVYLKNMILPLTLLFLLLGVLFAALLCIGAGRRAGSDEVKLRAFDRLPYELFIAVIAGIVILTLIIISNSGTSSIYTYIGWAAAAAVWAVLIEWLIMSTARRKKSGALWKNTVVFYIIKLTAKAGRASGKFLKYLSDNVNLYWKTALICAGVVVAELLVVAVANSQYGDSSEIMLALLFIEKLAIIPLIIVGIINVKKIRDIGKKLARGDIGEDISTAHMLPEFKKHVNNLQRVNEGMKIAVSEQLKSERMQTELITNVSHDIKTPLTSIINYVDLLKREEMPSEKAVGYLEVIDRQSKRLKKLAVDVVEASKATSGSIEVNSERTDVNVLISQTTGEYADKLTEAGLELVQSIPDTPLFIYADNRLIWRVFDNLMNNICKYSQRGTRVYLAARENGGKVEISFKNVSKTALNISADELMERFVRGDTSRNTEGSGLGLAISRSLTELQGGNLELDIDCDLFKATLIFPKIN